MTDEEARERAERIVTMCMPKDLTCRFDFSAIAELLNSEIAQGFQRVAMECGWQKELLKEYQLRARLVDGYLNTITQAAKEKL